MSKKHKSASIAKGKTTTIHGKTFKKPKKKKKNGHGSYHHSGYDHHHLLFQGQHWQEGWAKALREHPYMIRLVPTESLHWRLHSKIHDVPTPPALECKLAYMVIEQKLADGEISIAHDTIEQRLELLIKLWKDSCPATVAILEWQRDIVAKFYKNHRDIPRPNGINSVPKSKYSKQAQRNECPITCHAS